MVVVKNQGSITRRGGNSILLRNILTTFTDQGPEGRTSRLVLLAASPAPIKAPSSSSFPPLEGSTAGAKTDDGPGDPNAILMRVELRKIV